MCLGVPYRIIGLSEGWAALGSGPEGDIPIDMSLIGPVACGEWVLVHGRVARRRIDSEEAGRIGKALEALEYLGRIGTDSGPNVPVDLKEFFPDLAGRVPELPDFLKSQAGSPGGEDR